VLNLSVTEYGEILSRVHQAEQLEEFSLGIRLQQFTGKEFNDDDVRRMEDVWSMCTLKKVELDASLCDLPPPWYKQAGAVCS
jgi:hypothetical protein